MSDCRIIIKKKEIVDFLKVNGIGPEFDSGKAFIDTVQNLLVGKLVTYNYEGVVDSFVVSSVGYQLESDGVGYLMTFGYKPETDEKDQVQIELITNIEDYVLPELGPEKIEEDPEPATAEDFWSPVKLNASSTTRNDTLSDTDLKSDDVNISQRKLIELVEQRKHQLIAVVNDGTLKGPEGVVLVAVASKDLAKISSQADAIKYAALQTGLTIEEWQRDENGQRLTTEIQLGQTYTVPVSSFFGTHNSDQFKARDLSTLARAVNIIVTRSKGKVSEAEVVSMFINQLDRLQKARERAENNELVVLDIDEIGSANYPNGQIILNKMSDLDIEVGKLLTGKEGFKIPLTLRGRTKVFTILPSKYTKEEIDWMFANFNNTSNPSVLKSYQLLLGRNLVTDKVIATDKGLIYVVDKTTTRPATLEDLSNSLLKYPYRQRSLLLLDDSVYYLGSKYNSRRYLLEKFVLPHRLWRQDGQITLDGANTAIQVVQTTMEQVLDPYTTLEEYIPAGMASEIFVSEGTEVRDGIVLDKNRPGVYFADKNTIYYTTPKALFEERVHAATVAFIRDNPDDEQVVRLKEIYESVKTFYNDKALHGKFPNANYSFTSVEEFIARAITDKDTMQVIAEYDKANKTETVFTQFLEFIKRVFNLLAPTVNEVFEIYQYMKSKSSTALDVGEFFSQEVTLDLNRTDDKLVYAQSMDYLFLQYIESKNVTLDAIRMAIARDPKRINEFTGSFRAWLLEQPGYDLIKQTLQDYTLAKAVWLGYSSALSQEKDQTENEDQSDLDTDENIKPDKEFRSGPSSLTESAAIADVDNEIKAILSTIPNPDKTNKLGIPSFYPYKDLYYEVLDRVNGYTSLEELLQILRNAGGKFAEIERRINKETKIRFILLGKFHRSMNRYAVPFKILKQVNNKFAYIQVTGENLSKAEDLMNTNFYTSFGDLIGNDGAILPLYKALIKNALDTKNYLELARLLGADVGIIKDMPEFQEWADAQESETIRTRWDEALRATLYQPTDFKSFVAKSFKALATMYAQAQNIRKIRMAKTPDGNPIAAETIPNSLVEMVKLYRQLKKDENGNIIIPDGIEYNFLRNPSFQYSHFKNAIDTIEVIYQGGFLDESTIDLDDQHWLFYSMFTMLTEGYGELMRTETSSSSWGWRTLEYLSINPDDLVPIFTNYLRMDIQGYLNSKSGTEAYNAYRVKNSPSGASTLPSGIPNLLIFENFNLPVQTQEQLDNLTDEQLRPIVEQFMLNLSQEAYQSAVTNDVGKMFTDDVIAQLPATLDTLERITQVYALHDFIYHVEQTILFDGGIEYYKAYYKRAKGKISTGSNSIADPEYWDSLDPEQTIGGKLPPVLRVLNIKEPTDGYASGRFDGDIYIPGSPEFETIFQSQVDAAYRRKRMARLDVTREDVMREYLPKNAPYTDMKIGDGQGGINLDYLRAIQIGDGNWPEDAEATYQWEKLYYKVNYLGYTPSRTKQIRGMSEQSFYERGPQGIIPPVKYSYFGPSKELGHKPIFDKFSLFPMLPSMMKGTKMEDLTRQMIENKVAYFKYPSGTKAVITTSGPGSTVSLDNLDIAQSSAILTLSPRFLKEQEKVSFKNKVESIFGSQSRKLIFQDSMEMGVWVDFELTDEEYNQLFPDGAPDRVTYFNKVSNYMRSLKDQVYERSNFARRYRDYVNLMRRSMRLQHQQALTSMGLKEVRRSGIPIGYEISNPEEFAKILEKYNIDNNPAITDYVSMLKTGEGIPYIEFSSMSSEIRKTIGSIFRKKIATQKVHGQPLIMVSSANMTKIEWQKPDPSDYDKYGATGLRYYQVKDGQTMAAQIKTSYSTEFDSFKNNEYIMSLPGNTIREKLNEMLNRKEAPDTNKIESLRNAGMSNARQVVEAEHQMAIDFWNEHKESFTLFAKRIPTQGLSSMDVFEIREFLPESAGKILIPPLEIVAKAGSDFDIDKMYFFRPRLSKFTGKPLTDEPPIESVEAIDEQLRLIEMRLQPLLAEKKDLQKTVKALRVQMKDASDKDQIREIKSAIRSSTLTEAQKDELEELFTAKARLSGLREQVNLALDENKAVLQNRMLNVIKEQILDPLNYNNLTMPLGTGIIKAPLIKAAEQAFGKGVTDDKAGGENLTVKTHLLKRKSMLVAGKKLLGIAAVAVPGFQVQSKVRLLYSTSTAFSEGEIGALGLMAEPYNYNLLLAEKPYITESNVDASSMYSVDGVLKSEVLNQYVSAMVDAATENYAGFANHNFQTFPVAVFLVREGLPYQTIVDFMTSRVMRELEASLGMSPLLLIGNKESEIMSLISRSVPEESQAKELYNQYILEAIAEVRQDPSVLYTRFKNMDLALGRLLQDYILLGQYIIFKKKAGDAYHAQNMISVDTRPPKLVEDVTSINRPDDRVMADTAQRAIDQTELSAFNTRQMFVDILSSFFPALYNYQTITAFDTVTTALWTANRIKPQDLDLLRLRLPNEWAGFLFKNTTLQKGKAGVIAETLMTQIPKFYKTFKTDPVLRDTLLARDLKVFKVGNQMYTLGLVREAKDEIVEKIYYQELLAAYNDPKYTNLIKAIALVAMATTGYRKTFYSFTDILPPSILAPIFEITRLDYLKADQEALLKAFEDYMLNNYAPTGTPTYASGEVEYVPAVEYAQDEIPVLPEKAPGLLATQWSEIGPIIKEIQQRNGLFEFRVPLDTQVERGQKVVLRNSYATFVLHVTSVRRPSNTPGVRKGYSPFFYSNVSDYTSLALVGTLESYEVNIPISETPMPGSRQFRNPVRAGSGGAPGADFEFGKLISEHGGVVVHYYLADDDKKPPYGNHPISDPGLIQEARTKAINASTTMWANPRENPGFKALNDKKIIRNWFQVKYHDAVVAVSTIGSTGEVWVQDKDKENPRIIIRDGVVQGGTGYAVEMAKNEGKPIYVFNAPTSDRQSKYPEGWYQWNHSTKQFDRIDRPPFLSNFAAIGSRSLSPAAKKAIKDYIQVLLDEPIQELKIDETDFTRPISFTYKGKQYQSLAHAVLSNVDGIFNQWVYDNYSDNLISEIGKVMNLPITRPSDQSISPEVPKLPDGRSMLDVWHLDIQGKRVLKVNQEVEVYIPLMEIQGEHGSLQEFLNALKRDYPAPTLRESYALFRKTNKVIVKDVENGFVYFDYKGYELEIPREFIEVKKTDKYSVAPANNLRINNLANAIYKERWKEHLINNYGAFLELKKQAFNPGFVKPSSPISNEAMLNSLFSAGLTLQGTDVQRLIEEITQSAMGQNPGNVPSNTVITPTNATAPLAKAMAPYTAPKSTTLNVYNKVQKANLIITKFKPVDSVNIYYSTNENKELSNLADRPFNVEFGTLGVKRFKTVEGAYQASKMLFSSQPVDLALLEQFQNATGAEAKSLGRQVKGLNTAKWDSNSEKVMYPLILASFQQNPDARKRLLQTGQAKLTHTQDNTKWKEAFPKLLMQVRQELAKDTIVTTRTKDKFHFGNLASPLPKEKLGPQDLVPAVNVEQAVLNFIHWLTFMPMETVSPDVIQQAKSYAQGRPNGDEVKPGIYLSQSALTKEEQLELFEILKPFIETQAVVSNKGRNANKMIGLGLRWDYRSNNPSLTEVLIPDPMNTYAAEKFAYYDKSANGLSLGPITSRIRELMEKATGVDMTHYDGAIINLYDDMTFLNTHNDVSESRSAIRYPVIGVNLGGPGNFSIEVNKTDQTMLSLEPGSAYVFGVNGVNRSVFHRTFATPQKSFLPSITTKIDGQTYPAGSYRLTITIRRVMPLEPGMPKIPAIKNTLNLPELDTNPAEAAQVFLEGIKTLGMTPQQSADYVRIWFKEKDRRQWIINQLRDGSLKGKQLVYFSDTQEIIHADALKYLIDNAESFYPTLNSKNFDNSVRSLQAGAVVKFKDQQYIVGNISDGKVVLFSGDGTRYPSEVNSAELKIIGAYPMYDLENRSFILYNDKVFNGLGEEVTNLETIQIVKASAKVTASPASQKELSKKLLDPNDKELKIGSVVEYNGERYLFARENAGRAQLIDINFVKSPGTPSPKNLKAIGSYPVVDYNGTDYIVVSRDMIFSTASKNRVFQSQPNIADQLYSRAKLRQESPNAYKAYSLLPIELPELSNYKSAIDAMIPSYKEFLNLITGYITSGKDGTRQQFIGKESPQSFISVLNWNLTRVSDLYQILKSQINQIKTLEESNQIEIGTYDSVVTLGRVMKQIENIAKEDSDLICRL